jgi:hypothetical protein
VDIHREKGSAWRLSVAPEWAPGASCRKDAGAKHGGGHGR